MTPNRPNRLVVALGGNAITMPDGPADIPSQFAASRRTANVLADLLQLGHHLIITHGNGPQVGQVLRRVELSMPEVYPLPLEICVADTQAGMGYMIAQCLTNELQRRGRPMTVSAMVTTVLVERNDPAFANPSKPIGSYFDADQARRFQQQEGWVMKEVLAGKFRRVVPSPPPIDILEKAAIKQLVEAGNLVIACGGGGIPVWRDDNGCYQGVSAVVDKDLASALLAIQIDADVLMLLTSVPRVCINYQKPQQAELGTITISEAERYLADGQFPPGSMGPKINAALGFLKTSRKQEVRAIITNADGAVGALQGSAGTIVARS